MEEGRYNARESARSSGELSKHLETLLFFISNIKAKTLKSES